MRKALLIAALSMSVSSVALAADHAGDHGKPEAAVVSESQPAPVAPPESVPSPVPEEVAAEAAVSASAAAPVAAASVVAVEASTVEVVVDKPHAADWGYSGAGSAHKWGDLNAAYEACKSGLSQSPININQFMQDDLKPLALSYVPSPLQVSNTGHSVQVNITPGSSFVVDDKSYVLKQFHFHTPSEHYIDGAPYPMEVHFVHQAEDGALAVIGVMMKVGAHNPVIEGIWQNVPAAGETKTVGSVVLSASDLLPEDKSYYSYDGSLTTPPCSEGVKWHVLKDPIEISEKQLTAFQAVFPVNARPVQAVGERVIRGN